MVEGNKGDEKRWAEDVETAETFKGTSGAGEREKERCGG